MPSDSGFKGGSGDAAPSIPKAPSTFGDDEAIGKGLPEHWTLQDFQRKVRGLLEAFLSSQDADEAARCYKEFCEEASGFRDEVVVSTLRTALERSTQHQELTAGLLHRLHTDGVLDAPSLLRGFAKLICTWEELVVDQGSRAAVDLVTLLLRCMGNGCIDRSFLTRLSEGLLKASMEGREEAEEREVLEKAVTKLQTFKRGVEEARILERPPSLFTMPLKVLKELALPECQHEFVKKALVMALEWPPTGRGRCLSLLSQLHKKGALTKEDIQWGVIRVLGQVQELTVDSPNNPNIVAEQLNGLISEDLLPSSFIHRCQLLRIGGAAGLETLELSIRLQEEAAAKKESSDPDGEPSCTTDMPSSAATSDCPSVSAEAAAEKAAEAPIASAPVASLPSKASRGPAKPGMSLRPMNLGGSLGLGPPMIGLGLSLSTGTSSSSGPGKSGAPVQPKNAGYPAANPQAGQKGAKDATGVGGFGGQGWKRSWDKKGNEEDSECWRQDSAKAQQHRRDKDEKGGKGGKSEEKASEGQQDDQEGDQSQGKGGGKGSKKGVSVGAGILGRGENASALAPSEDSWAAKQRRRREEAAAVDPEAPSDEEILRRMKSILNKLTLEKFDELYKQLIECGISSEQHMRLLMIEVFEKATTQHHFIEMYTELCVHLNDWFSEHIKVGNFKNILLDQCQHSFEANLRVPQELTAASSSEEDAALLEEKRLKHKMRVQGNIRLVGLLLVRKMVSSKVLIGCSQELLKNPSPTTLEPLASLLTTTGREFDTTNWQYHSGFCEIFTKVKALTKDTSLPSRTRFLLQDVLDLRANDWLDQKMATKSQEGPKKRGELAAATAA